MSFEPITNWSRAKNACVERVLSMSRLLIRNARLVNEGEIREVNLLVRDGRIARIAPAIDACADDEIDAAGHFSFCADSPALPTDRSISASNAPLPAMLRVACRHRRQQVAVHLRASSIRKSGPSGGARSIAAVSGPGPGGCLTKVPACLARAARIEVIPPFAVALLKGSLWQGNGGRGVIHRSPAVTPGETPRVLLAMDADW
jgi:hypothetical protein